MSLKVCVVIPVFNEAKTIGSLVESIRERNLDVVVINDGSQDDSGEKAQEAGAVILTNDDRRGKGYSLHQGFDWAINKSYDGVLAMDGDGQHAVSDINRFLDLANTKQACVIVGNRLANPKTMPFVRFVTNKVMTVIISMGCGQKIADSQCGFRYISCEVLKRIQIKTVAYEIETEILMKSAKAGFPIYSIPIQTIYAREKSYINPVKDTWNFIKYFVKELFTKSHE